MWGGAQWHVIMCKLKGWMELIRCVNGCITSLGTEPANVMKCNQCACVTEVK